MMNMELTVNSLIDHAARYHGDAEIVSIGTDGNSSRSDWATVSERSRQLASALRTAGYVQGNRCATICWNNVGHLECYFGISGSGMVCHTINPRLFPEQLIYVINNAQDKVIFFDKTFLSIVSNIRDRLETVEEFVLMSEPDEEIAEQFPGLFFYEEFLQRGTPNANWPEIAENQASSLCYTSGTTGNPKGVLYSHRSTVLHALVAAQPDALNLSARDVVMPVVPMFHVNAWGVPYITAMVGAKLVLPGPGLDGQSLVKLIDSESVTIALGVPTIWQGLLSALDELGSSAQSLKRTVIGGSACPPSMMSEFRGKYGVEVVHAWGMTETSPIGTVNALLSKHNTLSEEGRNKIRESQGRPPYGVQLKIVGEDGHQLPEDGIAKGNLRIRGHWVVADYFGVEPNQTLEEDGWFETGDVASINDDGFMTIRDRSKDIIKSGGEWISTVELEEIAMGHSAINEAAVVAASHDKWDERPILLAVKMPDANITEEELLAHYQGKVAKWQIPDRAIFVEGLPRNATGKVLKNKLRSEYGKVLVNKPA
ncbi:long-chain fatty acid--CoA ligase [Halomonas titanicae]|nr:long-chain fatty acid--CoA ligase [Halomonas titanicae]NVE93065.1 long-chain fatty acid--CoA ligase [Halomonas titanicae]